MTVEVRAGQTQSNIAWNVPAQKTYAVRGFISSGDKDGLTADDVNVMLISLDGVPPGVWYVQPVNFGKWFPLPRTKYFNFEGVLPGRYLAYASVPLKGWLTKVVEIDVSNHMKFITLELIHKK